MAKISTDQALLKAKSHAKKGEIEDAKKLYQSVLQAFPKDLRAQQGLAALSKPKTDETSQTPPQEIIDRLLALYNRGQLSDVVDQAQALTEQYPEAFFVWSILGAANKGLGRTDDAANAFKRVTELNPTYADGFSNLGVTLKDQGKLDEAIAAYNKALSIKPDHAAAYYNMGVTLQEQGKLDEAIAAYNKALSIKPDYAEAYNNMGVTLQEQGKLDEAIAAYNKALSIKPDYAEAYYNMGVTLQEQGKLDEAIAAYNKALSIKPDYAAAYNNMGNALKDQGKLDEAIAVFNKALSIKPDYAEAYNNMGVILKVQGKLDEAKISANRALSLEPTSAKYALGALTSCLPIVIEGGTIPNPLWNFDKVLNEFVGWSKEPSSQASLKEYFGASQPFHLAYYPENMRDRLCAYANAVNVDVALKKSSLDHKTKERIKIGVVTSHLTQHSVFNVVMKGILSNLNRDHFCVHVFCTDATKAQDHLINELAFDEYFSVVGNAQKLHLKSKIVTDDLDALWYPEIGMDPVTSWLAIQRLAPVQFVSWGHPITTGFRHIDYFLSGELIEGVNSESHYSERLVKLPGTGCLTAFEKNTPKSSEWEHEQLPKNKLTFLIPQNPFKFHPMNDDLIIQIARLFPDAQFLVPQSNKYPDSVKQILGRIEGKFGSSYKSFETQFITFPWMKNDEFLSLMETADIYLDLPSFSGYTTAWQGVNCGIPIVTFEGEFMRQRLASGLLRKIGITDNIAQSFEEYVSIVQRLAKLREQPEQWQEYRQKIKNSAPKADNDLTVVRSFEQFLLKAVS